MESFCCTPKLPQHCKSTIYFNKSLKKIRKKKKTHRLRELEEKLKVANGLTWPLSLLLHPTLNTDTAPEPGLQSCYNEAGGMRERMGEFQRQSPCWS